MGLQMVELWRHVRPAFKGSLRSSSSSLVRLMRAETFASLASTYGLRVQDYPQGLGNRDLLFKNGALN
jgi:hypothetical protein